MPSVPRLEGAAGGAPGGPAEEAANKTKVEAIGSPEEAKESSVPEYALGYDGYEGYEDEHNFDEASGGI